MSLTKTQLVDIVCSALQEVGNDRAWVDSAYFMELRVQNFVDALPLKWEPDTKYEEDKCLRHE